MAIPNSLIPCREGDVLLIVIPNYWAKGKTIAEAKQALADVAGSHAVREAKHWIVDSTDPSAHLEDVLGQIYHKKDHPPLKIAQEGIKEES